VIFVGAPVATSYSSAWMNPSASRVHVGRPYASNTVVVVAAVLGPFCAVVTVGKVVAIDSGRVLLLANV